MQGAWFEGEVGQDWQAKSVSHEHTFNEDTADVEKLESTLLRLCEMVARRLREQGLSGRTWQLKLRYSDFSTITRAQSLPGPTTVDSEIFATIRRLFQDNWQKAVPSACWACKLQILMMLRNRWTCCKMKAGKSGRAPSPRLTNCGTNMAIPQSFWPKACAAASAKKSMKIRRKSPTRTNRESKGKTVTQCLPEVPKRSPYIEFFKLFLS